MQKEKILSKIKEAIEKIKKFYGLNIHSIYLSGSVAKDWPDLKGDYWDIDIIVFTLTRKAKEMKNIPGEIEVDITNMWFLTKISMKRGLKKNYTRFAFKEFLKNAKCLWHWRKGYTLIK